MVTCWAKQYCEVEEVFTHCPFIDIALCCRIVFKANKNQMLLYQPTYIQYSEKQQKQNLRYF